MKEQSAFDPQAKGRECRLLQGLLVAALVLLVPLQGFPQRGVGNPVTKEAIARRYGNAPEKRRAAEFLLDNMARHTSVYAPALDTYYDRLADIFAHDGYPACREKVRSAKMGTLYGYCRIEWEIIDGKMNATRRGIPIAG